MERRAGILPTPGGNDEKSAVEILDVNVPLDRGVYMIK